jgi:hypothetical protein
MPSSKRFVAPSRKGISGGRAEHGLEKLNARLDWERRQAADEIDGYQT